MKILLASKSPRRLSLLHAAGLTVTVRPAHVDESALAGESVTERVSRLAMEKAAACPHESLPVIAADTLVVLDDKVMGQPADLDEAKAMLECLSGRTHQVYTGVCVQRQSRQCVDMVCTKVRFGRLSSAQIRTYLENNEVLDKAGAYAIQDGAASFIEAVDGPLDNVIGLPVRRTLEMLQEIASP